MKDQQTILAIIDELKRLYPEAACSLPFDKTKAYELLFSVRLAAQCTDARVNMVTPTLYARFPTLESLAEASEEEVGEIIHSTGFWRAKARDIVAASKMLGEEYGGGGGGTNGGFFFPPGGAAGGYGPGACTGGARR